VLNAALEATTRLNESLLQENAIPTFERALKQGIKWQPEPPGDENFDHGGTVFKRGWGDCDDLAPYHAASLRNSGEDPAATAIVKRTGPKLWHAVVRRGDGSIDDPSKRAGMGQPHEYSGAFLPRMSPAVSGVNGAYIIRPQLALRPVRGGEAYQARTDIPWHYKSDPHAKPSATDYAMVALHAEPVADPSSLVGHLESMREALAGSVCGAIELAEANGHASPAHMDRLCCMGDALDGADFNELAGEYGHQLAYEVSAHLDGFFGGLKKLAKKALKAGTSFALPMAASFVPGGSMALKAAQQGLKMIPGGGGGGAPQGYGMPGAAAAMPHGPTGSKTGRFVFMFD
jgi:hypothetical protein